MTVRTLGYVTAAVQTAQKTEQKWLSTNLTNKKTYIGL